MENVIQYKIKDRTLYLKNVKSKTLIKTNVNNLIIKCIKNCFSYIKITNKFYRQF